jgi:hypothetical protein
MARPIKSPNGYLYKVESPSNWFICRARTGRAAQKVGTAQFGRGSIVVVERALVSEVEEYRRWKNLPANHVFKLEEPS